MHGQSVKNSIEDMDIISVCANTSGVVYTVTSISVSGIAYRTYSTQAPGPYILILICFPFIYIDQQPVAATNFIVIYEANLLLVPTSVVYYR